MRFVPLPLIACSLMAVIPTSQGYVSGVNARLTTAEPTNTVREPVTISPRGQFQARARTIGRNDDRITFPSSWSRSDLGQDIEQRSGAWQDEPTKSEVRGSSETGGSFTDSQPSTHSMQLRNSFPQNRVSVHPFETDDDDDRPIWRD